MKCHLLNIYFLISVQKCESWIIVSSIKFDQFIEQLLFILYMLANYLHFFLNFRDMPEGNWNIRIILNFKINMNLLIAFADWIYYRWFMMAIYMFSEMFRLTVVAQRENLIKNGIHTHTDGRPTKGRYLEKSTHFNRNKRLQTVCSAMLLSLSTGNEFSCVGDVRVCVCVRFFLFIISGGIFCASLFWFNSIWSATMRNKQQIHTVRVEKKNDRK